MCGRFSQTLSFEILREYFNLDEGVAFPPRYNIAPSLDVNAVRQEEGQRRLVALHWGLIPFWAKDRKIGYKTLNARSETAHKTPSFRAAFRSRRCLIPASGFFEWEKIKGSKQPHFIYRVDEQPLALAGLWERWEDKEKGETVESCTILTTAASQPVAGLHDRMPVILEPEDFARWLDPKEQNVERLRQLLQPAAPGTLTHYPVSTYVNRADQEGPECIAPFKEQPR
jgi:putative SOS response-associated peptidase YedK